MFRKVSAVVLFVQDFPKCLTFYRDVLGLEVAILEEGFAAFKMDDHEFALQELTKGATLFPINTSSTGNSDRVMLCAKVDNVDTAYETLKVKGVEFVQSPVNQYWGIRAAYFRDPDGNFWEISHDL